jgi:hypothetical protein
VDAGNRTRNLWICSQEIWPLDHRGSQCRYRKGVNLFRSYLWLYNLIGIWKSFQNSNFYWITQIGAHFNVCLLEDCSYNIWEDLYWYVQNVETNSCTCSTTGWDDHVSSTLILSTFNIRWIVFTHKVRGSYLLSNINTTIHKAYIFLFIALIFGYYCAFQKMCTDRQLSRRSELPLLHVMLASVVKEILINCCSTGWTFSSWDVKHCFGFWQKQSCCKCFNSNFQPAFTFNFLIACCNLRRGYHSSTLFH